MKIYSGRPRFNGGLWMAICLGAWLAGSGPSRAADGSWTVDADGAWTTPGNWLGGIVADGPGSTARFTNDLTAVRTITLSTAQTNGNLTFSDGDAVVTPSGWIVSGSGLTLSNSAATPIVTVNPLAAIDSTNDVVLNSTLTSPQGLIKKGQGTLTLTAANNFSNSVQIDEGVLLPLNAAAISTGNRAVIFNGGGVRVVTGGPNLTFTNQVLTSATIISSNGNYDGYNGPWSGTGTIFIHSTGRFTPGNNNAATFANFTGTIDLTDSVANETRLNLGSGSTPYDLSRIVLNCGSNSGRFDFRATVAPCRVLIGSLLGGPASRLQSSENPGGTSLFWEIGYLNTSTIFDGVIANRNSGADRVGHLVKVGTGKLTLTGVSPYTGVTTISNGVLALTGTAALSGATNYITVLNGGIFDVSGMAAPFALTSGQTLAGDGVVTGEVAIVSGRIAPGTSATGNLSFSNNLSMDGSALLTTNLFKLGSGVNDQIRVAGNLTLAGVIALRVVPAGAVIPNGSYVLYQWGGALSGDTNNFAVEYPAQAGVFTLSKNLGAKQIILQVSGVPSANNLTWRGDGGANAWDYSTLNWRNGATASLFSNGDRVLFDDTGSNNVPVDISSGNVNPSAVVVNATKPYTIGSTIAAGIAGSISLVKSNTGVVTITADNGYTAGTYIAGGTVQVGDGASTSGTLGSGIITNNSRLVYNRPDAVTVGPVITGSGVVVEQGAGGTLTLNSANTYTGGTTISNGTLRLAAYSAMSTGPATLAGGILEIVPTGSATLGLSNNLIVIANSTLQYDSAGTFAAVIFGGISGNPGATLTISHPAGTSDRLRLYGNFTNNANVDFSNAGIVLAPYLPSGEQVYNGVISGFGCLIQRGGGATELNGDNTYSGGTTNTNGRLLLGTNSTSSAGIVISGPLGSGPLVLANEVPGTGGNGGVQASGGARTVENPIFYTITNAFTFVIAGSNDLTLSGPMSLQGTADGNGGVDRTIQVNNTSVSTLAGVIDDGGLVCGLNKTGNGLLNLNGVNTYSGLTTVTAGSLGGTGVITGPVFVTAGGTLAPGASIGTLTINNHLTNGGNLFIEVNKSVSPSNDVVTVSGVLTNSGTGTLTVTNLGPALVPGDKFKLFNKPLVNGGAMTVTGGGVSWVNNLAVDGSITAAVGPPTLNFTRIGNSLQFSWTGSFKLQVETNKATVGLSNNWSDYPGGGTSPVTAPIVVSNATVFFRLISP